MGARPVTDRAAEAALLARARVGDGRAFATLVEAHRAGLYRYLMRAAGSPDQADDLVQETLIRAWRGLPGYRD